MPFAYKEWVGGFFYRNVITSRNRMRPYEMIPLRALFYKKYLFNFRQN